MGNDTRKTGVPTGPMAERPTAVAQDDPFNEIVSAGPIDMKIVQPAALHPIGSMYQGDPDSYDGSVQLVNMLPDDLPPGCDTKKYDYIQVNNNSRDVPMGLRELLVSTKAYRPVSPSNHPEIDTNLFTGGRLEMHDIHIWYGAKDARKNFMAAKRRPNNERFMGKVAGKDVSLAGAGPMKVRQSGSISRPGESIGAALGEGQEAFREQMEGIARKEERIR